MNNIQLKHPASLKTFFFTEMWERYGFYVVQSLLALYLAFHFKWNDNRVYELVGSFTALTYLTPFIGGWIADQLIGQKKGILVGAVVLCISYLTLIFSNHHTMLIAALAGVSTGTGLFKSNVSSLLGNQYPKASSLREHGFTIFYMGLTLGIVLGTTLPNLIQVRFGWNAVFISAACGMIISFFVFLMGIKRYTIVNYQTLNSSWKDYFKTLLVLLLLWFSCFSIMLHPQFADFSFITIVFLSILYLVLIAQKETPRQRIQTMIIGLLCLISLFFWAFYFQMFLSLTLFLVRVVNPVFLGFNFPPPYYVAFESVSMLVFGTLLIQFKAKHHLTIQGMAMRSVYKFFISMVLMAISYGLITLIARQWQSDAFISPLVILPAYFLIAVAELLLSPVGIGTITLLACPQKVSTMMGIYMVSLGLGAYCSGKLSHITAINPTHLTITQIKAHYAHSFLILLIILLACIIASYIISRIIAGLLKNNEHAC